MASLAISRAMRYASFMALVTMTMAAASADETVFYQFQPGTDGQIPTENLVSDSAGNLYGTTWLGGANNYGTVFKLTPDGSETILYSFKGGTDAASPTSLAIDSAGNLYGASSGYGAYGRGVVFKISPDGNESILHSFKGKDGELPMGKLLLDSQGNIYGTTVSGGDPKCASQCGTVFEIGTDGTEKVLHSFKLGNGGGINPSGGVIMDSAGNLYGTTDYGGSGTGEACGEKNGCGTVFELKPSGKMETLYSFQDANGDGYWPYAGLVEDSHGNLYGDTTSGCSGFGCVFKLSSDGTETVMHAFSQAHDGWWPAQDLLLDGKDNLYGFTTYGGNGRCRNNGCGTAFKITPSGTETILQVFQGNGGKVPYASPFMGNDGRIYGVAEYGGLCLRCGVVFSLTK